MPIYSASANKVIGVEALLRCRLQGLKDISPEVYISIAEETGLVRDIDLMVIDMALRDFSQFNFPHDFTLSINLSSKELLDTSFVSHFKRMVNRAEFDFNRLCLEITETFLLDIDTVCIKTIDDFRAMGCKVSLDDFGTGYTSFQQLVNFPVDEIKIDRDFIGGMKNNKGYDAIVNSLISIADAYNYKVVAEGVEDIETYELLVSKGCDFFQGYYFSKPIKLSDIYLMTEKI
jgi:EAL domain-containing protein (putative c-di-GMP-specific phosphodiesterase class I)